jgi:hypothetical protein
MSTNRTFNDIIKEFEEKTYEELLSLASGALSLVAKAFSNLANTERPGELILPFIFTTLGVDGELSEIEAKFLNDLFNADFDYDALKNYALAYNDEEIVELIENDPLSEDILASAKYKGYVKGSSGLKTALIQIGSSGDTLTLAKGESVGSWELIEVTSDYVVFKAGDVTKKINK